MANIERWKTFRELVDLVEAEFAARDMPLKPGAAAQLMRERVERVAARLRVTPRTALTYFSRDIVLDLARHGARVEGT